MKLQRATLLALYAVLELADQQDQQLSRQEIAEKFDVSSNHLSKVMRELGRAGRRGRRLPLLWQPEAYHPAGYH